MRLLAIDTSGAACSAALLTDAGTSQRLSLEPRRHGALLLGMVDELLADAGIGLGQLDALAFGRGPGSFTGVRISTAVVQGLAYGADLPVVPVSTLAGLAQGHHRVMGIGKSLTAVDARMGEVYWGRYVLNPDGLMRLRGGEQVAAPGQVELPSGSGWHGIGSGWSAHAAALRQRLAGHLETIEPDALCESRDIAALAVADLSAGRTVSAEHALPVYLRDQVTATRPVQLVGDGATKP